MKRKYEVKAKVIPIRSTERYEAVCPICDVINIATHRGMNFHTSREMSCEHFDGMHIVVGDDDNEKSGDFFKFISRTNHSPVTHINDLMEMLRLASVALVEQTVPQHEIEYFDVYQLLMMIAEFHPEPNVVRYLQQEIVGMESHRGDDS